MSILPSIDSQVTQKVEDTKPEQSTSLMVTPGMETSQGPTLSMDKGIGATAWRTGYNYLSHH